ncbi:MAG: hypothetical protein ACRDKJ_06225 [Actinomycetota bacterium]
MSLDHADVEAVDEEPHILADVIVADAEVVQLRSMWCRRAVLDVVSGCL